MFFIRLSRKGAFYHHTLHDKGVPVFMETKIGAFGVHDIERAIVKQNQILRMGVATTITEEEPERCAYRRVSVTALKGA